MIDYCSINNNKTDDYTCFEHSDLLEIAKAYNKFNRNVCASGICIKKQKKIKINGLSKEKLYNEIKSRLKGICKEEFCWVDANFMEILKKSDFYDKIKYFTFKPEKPDIKWLSTVDINNILQQYQGIDESFKFVGAVPSDFYNIQKVKYNDILKYDSLGIVINTDDHTKKGQHWTSIYICNKENSIEFFDSTGRNPNRNVKKFIEHVISFLLKKGLKYKIKINKNIHQKQNTECGIYSINFILQRLLGKSFEDISNKIISDKNISKLRNELFR